MATIQGGKGMETTLTAFRIPLSAVAKWPAPNFRNPVRRTWYIPYSITFFLLATLVVAARLWTRMNRKAGGYGWDDSLILGAWVRSTPFTLVERVADNSCRYAEQVSLPWESTVSNINVTDTVEQMC